MAVQKLLFVLYERGGHFLQCCSVFSTVFEPVFFACLINALCERGMVTLYSAHLPVVTLRANRRIAILTDMRKIVLRIASPPPILREQQNM